MAAVKTLYTQERTERPSEPPSPPPPLPPPPQTSATTAAATTATWEKVKTCSSIFSSPADVLAGTENGLTFISRYFRFHWLKSACQACEAVLAVLSLVQTDIYLIGLITAYLCERLSYNLVPALALFLDFILGVESCRVDLPNRIKAVLFLLYFAF